LTQSVLTQDTDFQCFRPGATAAWSEPVSIEVKKLTLNSPATPEKLEALIGEAEKIAAPFDISILSEFIFNMNSPQILLKARIFHG
jgi:hypothetical protein